MRKRAQRKSKPGGEVPKHVTPKPKKKIEKKPLRMKKTSWIALSLIAIFFLVLFFNTFFNATSNIAYNPDGEGFEKYYLSGPDPYYNMRLVEETYETGVYPYYSDTDPLLNYPLGRSGGRPPLLNMMALGFSRLLTPFTSEVDAIGISMQFIPALFGALIIFPVYFLAKNLFNKKTGLIAALFLAIIPIHIGSGHGSAYSLFDHDSLNLLLFFTTFLFLVMALKEKNHNKSTLYALLGGFSLAALTMTWVESQFLFVVISAYAIVQIFVDIFTNKIEFKVFRTTTLLLFTGYFVSLPVIFAKTGGIRFDSTLLLPIAVAVFGGFYYYLGRKKIPWTISLPFLFSVGAVGMVFLYYVEELAKTIHFLAPLNKLSNVVFGSGIYGKKVSMTIAEANTFEISHTVMSFGPALYWIAWAGFLLLIWNYYSGSRRRGFLFIIILFVINIWLTSTAGRFLNDMVPLIAILGAWVTWFVVSKLDYKQMFRNIRSAGGGFHGLRRGIKLMHILGVLFVAFLVLVPNAFITLDAAVPNKIYEKEEYETEEERYSNWKWRVFGEGHSGAFGLSISKEVYWGDAFNWLSKQDTNISDPVQRPAFISWWDYGFYEVALGGHPAVADNFQDGIPPASNLHTATSEEDAVIIWMVRLLEGEVRDNDGKISDEIEAVLEDRLGVNNSELIVKWMEDPKSAPSYGDPIGAQYDKNLSKDFPVGEQWPINAVYHDVIDLLTNQTQDLSDDDLTWLYHDIQEVTGNSIRYYGVEGYDRQIFNIFAFLADKSLVLQGAPEDQFVEIYYTGYRVNRNGDIVQDDLQWSANEIKAMSDAEKRYIRVTGTNQRFKDPFFETMFYKTYIGPYQTKEDGSRDFFQYQVPCVDMKHFYAEYFSNISNPLLQYNFNGKAAVVIAKYYEGAYLNGTVLFEGSPINNTRVVVQKNVSYTGTTSYAVEHDKYDIISDSNPDGEFNVIAGAGAVLQIRKRLGESVFVMKNITFNGEGEYAPITEDDAMRRSDNYERILNITIDSATIEGRVYDDLDDDEEFNTSVDKPIKDITVVVQEIKKIGRQANQQTGQDQMIISEWGMSNNTKTDENGLYMMEGLVPGLYRVQVVDDDGNIYKSTDTGLNEGNNTLNVTKPKESDIEGMIYYDANQDDEYDSGEELGNVDVELVFRDETINSTVTDEEGMYSFESVFPGKIDGRNLNAYTIKATKADVYEASVQVYPEQNKTLTKNISIGLTPVELSGQTLYNGNPVEDIPISFIPDETVDKNTAASSSVTSDENGLYTVDLQPGSYNISIEKYDEEDEVLIYHVTNETIELQKGQQTATKDFSLIKDSVNLSGYTRYGSENIANISILLRPIDYINITIAPTAMSDENGEYSLEAPPGEYFINASSEIINETGVEYKYTYGRGINLTQADIATGKQLDIVLTKEEI